METIKNTITMTMKSAIPTRGEMLQNFARHMLTALKANQEALGIKQNTADKFETELKAYEALDAQFQAARTKSREELTPSQTVAVEEARLFIGDARHSLRRTLGNGSNQSWVDAGFANGSLKVPRKVAEIEVCMENLAAFLKARPDQESSRLGVTAANAAAIHLKLHGIRDSIMDHETKGKKISRKRSAACQALRTRVQHLIAELRQVLAKDDPRWAAFGVESPAERRRKGAELRARAKAEAEAQTLVVVPAAAEAKAA